MPRWLFMCATRFLGRLWLGVSVKIEPIQLPILGPFLLQLPGHISRSDFEARKRQDRSPDGHARFSLASYGATVRAPHHWREDVPLRPSVLQHRVQRATQLDECRKRHSLSPFVPQQELCRRILMQRLRRPLEMSRKRMHPPPSTCTWPPYADSPMRLPTRECSTRNWPRESDAWVSEPETG